MEMIIHKTLVKNNKGAALIVTLAIISILLAAALHLGKTTGDSVIFTIKSNDTFAAKQMALSGINLAKLFLVEDAYKTKNDSVQEAWASHEELEKAVNELGYEDKALELKISDELGKIQINALVREYPGNLVNQDQRYVLERFFELKIENDELFKQRDSSKIINSLKDWLDSLDDDTITGVSGAESDYYLNLIHPYPCANGPFNSVYELLNSNGLEGLESFKFENFFTVHGLSGKKSERSGFQYPGKININTAGADVISAILPHGMEGLAQELVDFRAQMGPEDQAFINKLDKGWYEKVIELSEKEKHRINNLVKYSSDIFKVECTAKKNDVNITIVAFMKREKQKKSAKWSCRIIQMEQR